MSPLQITGLIVLGWFILAVVVAYCFALFMRGAHRLERHVPTEPKAIRAWVRGHKGGRKVRHVA